MGLQALAQDQKGALEQLLCACPGLERVKVWMVKGMVLLIVDLTTGGNVRWGHSERNETQYGGCFLIVTRTDELEVVRETASVIFTNFVGTNWLSRKRSQDDDRTPYMHLSFLMRNSGERTCSN